MKFHNKYNLYYCLCNIINDKEIKKNNGEIGGQDILILMIL